MRVILMCGSNAQQSAMAPIIEENHITVTLRGYSYSAYLELDEGKHTIKRIYVRSLALLLSPRRSEKWQESVKLSEMFRFATTVTKTLGIRTYYCATRTIYREIILRCAEERDGIYEQMMLNSIDPAIREWLYMKGLRSDDHIETFERLGGSLMRGIFLFLITLPECPPDFKSQRSQARFLSLPKIIRRAFNEWQLQESRRLFKVITGKQQNEAAGDVNAAEEGDAETTTDLSKTGFEARAEETLRHIDEGPGNAITHEDLHEILESSNRPNHYESLEHPEDIYLQDKGFQRNPRFKSALSDPDSPCRAELFQGKWYKGSRFPDVAYLYQIGIPLLHLRFRKDKVDIDEGFIVKVLVNPIGVPHPNVYATQARDSDPAARVAFEIKGMLTTGTMFTVYPTEEDDYLEVPTRVNAFFDWMNGATLSEIAITNMPRRFIYLPQEEEHRVGPELKRFSKGEFTDESLSNRERQAWEAGKKQLKKLQRI